jgi:hypothetical protein
MGGGLATRTKRLLWRQILFHCPEIIIESRYGPSNNGSSGDELGSCRAIFLTAWLFHRADMRRMLSLDLPDFVYFG